MALHHSGPAGPGGAGQTALQGTPPRQAEHVRAPWQSAVGDLPVLAWYSEVVSFSMSVPVKPAMPLPLKSVGESLPDLPGPSGRASSPAPLIVYS